MGRPAKPKRRRKNTKQARFNFLLAYSRNHCLLATTCKEKGLTPEDIKSWCDVYPDFRQAKKELEELENDQVEFNLRENTTNNVVAQIFWLKNRRKEKWGEQAQQIDVNVKPLWFENKPRKQIEEAKEEAKEVIPKRIKSPVVEAEFKEDNESTS